MSIKCKNLNCKPRIPLLLTASVNPNGMQGACFSIQQREQMYIDALNYYIKHLLTSSSTQKIVFAENSGWDTNRIKKRLIPYDATKIEFISLNPDLFDNSKGKGSNELLMINLTSQSSKTIQECKAFFKATGRYPIFNIQRFIEDASNKIFNKGLQFYCDIKDHNLYKILNLGWSGQSFEARLWGATLEFYTNHISHLYTKCNDYQGLLVESVIFQEIKNIPHDNISLRFPREPHFGGLEGSDISALSFSKDQDSIKGKIKRGIGNFVRFAMPWFKF